MSEFLVGIPPLIRYWCLAVMGAFVLFVVYLCRDLWRVRAACDAFADITADVTPSAPSARQQGLSLDLYNKLEERALRARGWPRRWWDTLADAVVDLPSADGRPRLFLVRQPEEVLSGEAALGGLYHSNFHGSVPGLLTGLGLTGTFVAILLALAGMSYDAADTREPIKGIGPLINGLSGKFLASIVALGLAVLYTLLERAAERHATNRLSDLLHAFARVVPVLTAEKILLDIRASAAKQAVSLSNISSDVVDRFVNVFRSDVSPVLAEGLSAEMAMKLQPTLDQMNATLLGLSAALERLEAQKQDSVTSEIRTLLSSLETSMQATLRQMGDGFRDALSGSTRDEFGSIDKTLHGTAELLQSMNGQFVALQTGLEAMVAKADQMSTGQLQASREQADALTTLMQALMTQMHQASESNVEAMGARLTMVVDDLSRRVSTLSEEMISATSRLAARSQESAGAVIAQADSWSAATSQRLETLLKSIEARSDDFRLAGETLVEAQAALAHTATQNHQALQAMHDASAQVAAYTTALAGQARVVQDVNEKNARIAASVAEAIGALRATFDRHTQLLQQHDGLVTKYDSSFADLDQRLDRVLKVNLTGLQNYAQTMEGNFRAIVSMTNDTVPDITKALQAQASELQDSVEELADALSKATVRLRQPEQLPPTTSRRA